LRMDDYDFMFGKELHFGLLLNTSPL
jgi:hypothetical protein